MRITSILFSLIAATTFSLTACSSGGGDDGGGGGDDAPDIDASPNPDDPDANNNTTPAGLGSSCTPDTANPPGQGDCPTGFICLGLDGATGAYCTKTCPGPSDMTTTCDPGFDQPGIGYCFLGVDFTGDMMADQYYCGIICDDSGGFPGCPDCDGTCPDNYLQCTAPLMGGTPPMTIAQGCQ